MYNLAIEEVIKKTETDIEKGLTQAQVAERLLRDGKNMLQEKKRVPAILRFAKQLTHIMNMILFVAFFLTVALAFTMEDSLKEIVSAILILSVILINASIGYIQENKAEKAIEALKNQTKPYAKVLRDGVVSRIKNEDLCIGDIVLIEAGDIVPADIRLFEAVSLQVEQAALTGESVPSEKFTEAIAEKGIALGDRNNMAFSGGTTTYGRGKGIVTAIGMKSEMGRIAQQLNEQKATATPLTLRLNKTFKMIAMVVAVVSVIIFASRLIMADSINQSVITDSLVLAIAIAVCSIPEALPTCISIGMALATQRMSKKKAIIRSLPAVETLGSTQVICSDKTGTITLNKMTVQKLYTLSGDNFFNMSRYDQIQAKLENNKNLTELGNCMVLCNDTQTSYSDGELVTIGDPTETALVHCLDKLGIKKHELEKYNARIGELPFDSNRKLMSTLHKTKSGTVMYCKGAPVNIIDRCTQILDNGKVRPITKADIALIDESVSTLAKGALRVLGFAYKPLNATELTAKDESGLIFIGLTGMIDPPREEVFASIQKCKEAGIKVVMITGDNRDTAFAIAKQVGIAECESQVMTGAQLNEISDEQLIAKIEHYSVYARVDPEHKTRIVHAFQSIDKIVAMTGDGVNDAPSIKAANIGIGMGITGTDVTKAAADAIITDDNFATIVDAVEEGRRVHTNVKKTIVYLLGLSIGELILLTFITALLPIVVGADFIFFSAILILWINVVANTLPALVLGALPAERDVMKNGPNTTRGSIFKGQTGVLLIVSSMILVTLVGFAYFGSYLLLGFSQIESASIAYLVLVTIQCLHAYNLINLRGTVFQTSTFASKWMNLAVIGSFMIGFFPLLVPGLFQDVLGLVMLTPEQWAIGIAIGCMSVFGMEVYKIFKRRRYRKSLGPF